MDKCTCKCSGEQYDCEKRGNKIYVYKGNTTESWNAEIFACKYDAGKPAKAAPKKEKPAEAKPKTEE